MKNKYSKYGNREQNKRTSVILSKAYVVLGDNKF